MGSESKKDQVANHIPLTMNKNDNAAKIVKCVSIQSKIDEGRVPVQHPFTVNIDMNG